MFQPFPHKKSQASRPVPPHHHPNQWHPCPSERLTGTLARSIVKFWEILVGTTWSLPGHRLPIQGRLVLIISIAETCLNHVHPQVLSIAVFWSSTGPGLSEIVGQYQINVWKCWTISSSFNSALSCKLLWGWTMFFLSKVYARLDHYQCRGGLG